MGILRDTRGRVLIGREMDWEKWRMVRRRKPPPASQFTAVNQGSATWTVNRDKSVTLYAPPSAGHNLRCWVQTAPATPWTRTVNLRALLRAADQMAGLLFRESSTGRLHSINVDGAGDVSVIRWTSPTVLSSTDAAATFSAGEDIWLRIEDDGTSRNFYLSNDHNFNRINMVSVVRTTFLTANQWGIFINESAGSYEALATFFSLEVG